jgi:4-amino-4-deoxy-L-arabinose transferase-like glycosyltransferase
MSTPKRNTEQRPVVDGIDPWERRAGAGSVLLIILFLVQGLIFIGASSQTSDEAVHLAAGYSYLTRGDFRLNPEHPPLIKQLSALPLLGLDLTFPEGDLWDEAEEWNIGRLFVHENRVPNDTLLLLGRLLVLALSCLLAWLLFHWSRSLFGPRAALLSLALYVLDPNVVAHSCLITTDLGITLFIFLSVYALWRWSEHPTRGGLILLSAAVGGTFAAKYTALWLLPILGVLAVALLVLRVPLPVNPWHPGRGMGAGGRWSWSRLQPLLLATSVVAAIAFLVVAVCYGVVGLPAYVEGLNRTLTHSAQGHTAYLMGDYSDTGWWYYFLFAYLIKTPPGILVLVGLSVLALYLGLRRSAKDELFLYLPILLIIAITCVWKVNIGLRHLLPIYPFLFVGVGRLLARRPIDARAGRLARLIPIIVLPCVAWAGWATLSIAPHHLAYFNGLIGGPENGHLYLLDSNLDWGQSAKEVRRYMEREKLPSIYLAFAGNSDPWYEGVRYQYVPGSGNLQNPKDRLFLVPEGMERELLAVSVMVVHSVQFTDQDLYDWLKDRRPIAMPGYSYMVYDITGDADMHANVAVTSLRFGLFGLAEVETRRTLRLDPENLLAHRILAEIERHRAAGGAPG